MQSMSWSAELSEVRDHVLGGTDDLETPEDASVAGCRSQAVDPSRRYPTRCSLSRFCVLVRY